MAKSFDGAEAMVISGRSVARSVNCLKTMVNDGVIALYRALIDVFYAHPRWLRQVCLLPFQAEQYEVGHF